jgi:hypothetical protein
MYGCTATGGGLNKEPYTIRLCHSGYNATNDKRHANNPVIRSKRKYRTSRSIRYGGYGGSKIDCGLRIENADAVSDPDFVWG